MAGVTELICYPVKGCAGTPVSEAVLTPAGLAYDRAFMVISEDGVFRTQRRDPRLALIRPAISADGRRLVLGLADDADGHGAVRIDVTTSAPRRDVDLFGTAFRGIDQGDDVAAWLSGVLGTPSRLVRVPPEHDRIADGLVPGPSGYADSSAVHLLSAASLDLLNRRMAERGAPPLPMDRFRPNIVVDGDDWAAVPHAEDRARRITVAGTELGYAKLAVRCAVTLVAQEAGARRGPEPLRTLAGYRRAASGGVVFGAKFSVITPGKLSVGDEVTVTEWGEAER
ncbi:MULTISPECIES: MOSC N-terminal beta barrel domain-containing protein [unclassified Streptomyces]|uniref:MOSC domain-containing protein n=1 Tax=unclassified Streptomyces TaxID=2593676 RepID=UPI002ED52454|nr:MOSC N-terminal beta barrel domain-containing protein [Streptomyces sp. NBC_00891]WSY06658.1 MOSC N-terminal beta barrel domain-containing protein [Streptomyces sp. NBC_00890]WSZ08282.1 MOSC N-terminal beta barrel domain-containing protein [Streptomyces sp. NBC_00869]WSZ24219.1 MOSC N-terminal beta barrel domain-containing protein [Streptomyces sp. NBC_00870]